MAKHLSEVKLLVLGDGYGPSTARFVYTVCGVDDPDMRKSAHYTVDYPDFGTQSVQAFFDGYVAVIQGLEGIS